MAENAGYVKESDATTEEIANRKLKLRKVDIWALGITIVIGGQYFSWNAGYAAGFGSYLISTVLIGTSYICLCVCNAEISSALPFAGGAYGLARVSLGMYPGFIIGCLEAGEYIVYVASSAIALAMNLLDNKCFSSLRIYRFHYHLHIWLYSIMQLRGECSDSTSYWFSEERVVRGGIRTVSKCNAFGCMVLCRCRVIKFGSCFCR
jgi:amino acid transporter